MKHYDYLIVGAGLFGSVFAHEQTKNGKKCLVIDKRNHIGGNIYTENRNGINVHKYGAHIFHTSDKEVWDYVNEFAEFNDYINSPIANFHGETYHLPFNMYTFEKMWGVHEPEEAKKIIEDQIKDLNIKEPKNLEEHALSMVGRDVYEKLVKGYTEKQWGRDCKDLPASIIKRLPVRFEFNNNYFNDLYQGIPIGGYTKIIEKLLAGVDRALNVDFETFKQEAPAMGITYDKLLFTGMIDEYFNYSLGHLEYRTLRFETEYLKDVDDYQSNAVVNYTDRETPFTRIIEHKHFEFNTCHGTYITHEYPAEWKIGDEPYYPVNNDKNAKLYEEYLKLSEKEPNVIFGGRLGMYKYFDMDKTIRAALDLSKTV